MSDFSGKKVLVTGARGMLGTDVVGVFADADVTAWDLDELDIADAKAVEQAIRELSPDIVINCAAFTAVDDCEEKREVCDRVNGYAVEYLTKACADVGAKFVSFSTDYVFAGDNPNGYDEDAEGREPVNEYGRSKLIGEKAMEEYGKDWYLVRISWLFGLHGGNFVETMLRLGNERDEVKVVNDQHGRPTYTIDVARGLRELLGGDYESGVYHMANSGECTWYEFAKEIYRLAGLDTKVTPVTSEEFPRPAARPEFSYLNNTKLPEAPDWKDALVRYIESRD